MLGSFLHTVLNFNKVIHTHGLERIGPVGCVVTNHQNLQVPPVQGTRLPGNVLKEFHRKMN